MDYYVRHLFKGVRVFPDDPFYKSTGLVGKKEIVSLGCGCLDHNISEFSASIFFQYNTVTSLMCADKERQLLNPSQKVNYIKDITKEQAENLAQEAMKNLRKGQQLIYYEQCSDGNVPDYAPFEFCGFELDHTYEGGSPHLDIGYPFNNDPDVTEKLNQYGLFKTFEDILYYKKKVDEDDTKENGGEPTDDCIIHGVWRYTI